MQSISILIPVLDDAPALRGLLERLETLWADSTVACQVVVIDGGSADGSETVGADYGCLTIQSSPGRGRQLQAGFAESAGDWIWMLHADSELNADATGYLRALEEPAWGRFDVRFCDGPRMLSVVARLMNWRSRLTGIATGDQGIFVHRALLDAIGGVPRQALMEDVELSKRLKALMPPLCPRVALGTSGRRWRTRGFLRTVLGMWWFRLRYWLGADPDRLAAKYYL